MSRRPPTAPVSSERWRLEDEREFLVRSLDDAELEHSAGDLSPGDFELLRRRGRARLDEVEASRAARDAALDAGPAPGPPGAGRTVAADGGPGVDPSARADGAGEVGGAPAAGATTPGHRRRRWWLVAVGAAAMAAGAVLLVVHLNSPQLPGQSISGSVDLNASQQIQQELAQAAALANEGTKGSVAQALAIYRQVLAKEPDQPQALAEVGWLEWEAGAVADKPSLVAEGKALVQRSLKVEPDDYAAHFSLGTILLKEGDAAGAAAQYRTYLAQGPPAGELAAAAPYLREAFTAAGLPLPAGVPAG